VQQLISIMFDIEMMKNTLIELEIDVKKMPLGMPLIHSTRFFCDILSHTTAPPHTSRRHLKAS
jgi:hypothetical protein